MRELLIDLVAPAEQPSAAPLAVSAAA
jgi:hypothetical protein